MRRTVGNVRNDPAPRPLARALRPKNVECGHRHVVEMKLDAGREAGPLARDGAARGDGRIVDGGAALRGGAGGEHDARVGQRDAPGLNVGRDVSLGAGECHRRAL